MNKSSQISECHHVVQSKRSAAVDAARASVRLEGFVISPEVEALHAKYVNGEITSEEGIDALNRLYKR